MLVERHSLYELWVAGIATCIGALVVVGRFGFDELAPGLKDTWFLEARTWLTLALWIIVIFGLAVKPWVPDRGGMRSAGVRIGLIHILLISWLCVRSLFGRVAPHRNVLYSYELLLILSAILSVILVRSSKGRSHLSETVSRVILGLVGFVAAMGLYQLGTHAYPPERLAVFGGPNVFGRLMGFGAILTLAATLRTGKIAFGLVLGVFGGLLIVSGSRGSVVATVIAVVFLLWSYMKSLRPRVLVRLVIATALGALVVFITPLGGAVFRVGEARLVELLFIDGGLGHRYELIEESIRLFAQRPISGSGLGSFQELTWIGVERSAVYPHNMIAEIGVAGGGIALAMFLFGIAYTAGSVLRRLTCVHKGLASCFVMMLAASMVSGDLYDARAVFLLPVILFEHSGENRAG